jgi:hypothetical protein
MTLKADTSTPNRSTKKIWLADLIRHTGLTLSDKLKGFQVPDRAQPTAQLSSYIGKSDNILGAC